MKTRAWMTSGLLAGTALMATGCIPEQKYNDLMTAYKGQEQQLLAAQNELSNARANEDRLRSQLAATMSDLEELQKKLASGGIDMDEWMKKYDELKRQLASLEVGALPPDLSGPLADLAKQYPDYFDFDAKTGMLRFKSDFTFDPGSDALKPGANEVLGKLAAILNSSAASKFEVKVVGHTDDTPVVRTKAKFGNNVMLSVYRSASLRNALVKDGVDARRFQVAGYGEYRPVVSNGAKGATENRRVELFLTPLAFDLSPSAASAERTPAEAPVAKKAAAPVRGKPANEDIPTK
ncbi:MAG: OmpA family protein [Phycisphaerales bacterium]